MDEDPEARRARLLACIAGWPTLDQAHAARAVLSEHGELADPVILAAALARIEALAAAENRIPRI